MKQCTARAALLALALAMPAAAQESAPPAQQSRPQGTPPAVMLGARIEALRQGIDIRPTVVIVSNSADYARLIGNWSLQQRFPVLIDDGSDRAREDIARFVRAFKPSTVVRWSAPEDALPLPAEPEARRGTLEQVFRASWGAASPEQLAEVWEQTQFDPPGVVVASPDDPAWTAAIALAAGRGQPFVWVGNTPRRPGEILDANALERLESELTKGLESLGRSWRALGDDIDAVTLCLNIPSRITVAGDRLALTDRIGRHADESRWAWCGLIFGDEARAAYGAMCALFLDPSSAMLFDGYSRSFAPPYALERAAELLSKAGWKAELSAAPRGGLDDWRARTRFGLTADLVLVNSSGMSNWFDLTPGRARSSDVPSLNAPAVVHFIHSFSAEWVDDPATIAGRWIANGAHAYYGSVSEPYLAAFIPGPAVAGRLLARAPFGAAVRQDGGKPWKLNVIGDPLLTMGQPLPRHAEALVLDGAQPVEDAMKQALTDRRFGAAAADLVLLGRDEDAVRVAQAALARDKAPNHELARLVFPAAVRRRDTALAIDLYAAMNRTDRLRPVYADLFWQVARAELAASNDERLGPLLRDAVRDASMVEDAAALAPFLVRTKGAPAARSLIAALIDRAPNDETRARLVEESRKY